MAKVRIKDIRENFIKIDPAKERRMLNFSGLPLKMVRTGNAKHSTRKTYLQIPGKKIEDCPLVMVSYSKANGVSYCFDRTLAPEAETYLNPEYKKYLED